MRIQKYIYIVSLAALVAGLASCGKKLDIEPKQNVDANTAITTAEDVEQTIIGAYGVMDAGALYGCKLVMFPELYATDKNNSDKYLGWLGSFDTPREIANKTISVSNGDVTAIWIQAYRTINIANTVLESLDVVKDQEQQQAFKGEALFIRGLMHFELVRLFAQQWTGGPTAPNAEAGVPILLKASSTTEIASEKVPRKTIGEVYQQVIQDLTDASNMMPEDNAERASKYTALAILARVYLQKGDYANALAAADQVIQSTKYALNAKVTDVFETRNTRESVWEIQQNDQNNAGNANDGLATFYTNQDDGNGGVKGRADFVVSEQFAATFDADDLRGTELIYVGTGSRRGALACGKYTDFGQNIPIVRISEMYLIRAECNLRLGSAVGAVPAQDLNLVRRRAGLADIAAPVLDDIIKERVFEFFGEGLAVHDLKRLNKPTYGGIAFNDRKMVFPIPERERQTNNLLEQNPGY